MNRYLFIILAFVIPSQAFSNKGPYFFTSKSGNVETLIIIDDPNSSEIQKIKVIGDLCNSYLLNSDFKDVPVYIWYGHPSNLNVSNDSTYISYDKGKSRFYNLNRRRNERSQLLNREGVVIRIITSTIDAKLILKLLEYGLYNKEYIKKNQRETHYSYWTWQSLSRKDIDQKLRQFRFSLKIDSVND